MDGQAGLFGENSFQLQAGTPTLVESQLRMRKVLQSDRVNTNTQNTQKYVIHTITTWSRCEALGVSLGNLLVLGGALVLVLVFVGDLDTIFSFSQATSSRANSVKELRC